jgi:hypothetical protein
VELVVVVEVVVATVLIVPLGFPIAPGTSPDVPDGSALAFLSWYSPFVAVAASARQLRDLFQPMEGSVEDSSLVEVG